MSLNINIKIDKNNLKERIINSLVNKFTIEFEDEIFAEMKSMVRAEVEKNVKDIFGSKVSITTIVRKEVRELIKERIYNMLKKSELEKIVKNALKEVIEENFTIKSKW